ncbi:uncharacterized protein LOC128227739 isoform X2 [Mya arenaria]|nr:uncharacterized protein LOC128227739 isoform X2 [Mya arenaria]
MHYNTRRLTMYSLLFSLIAMSVLRDSLETVTEIDVIALLKNTSVPPLVTGSNYWSDWSPDRIIDGNNGDGDADKCKCCAALYQPAWATLDLNSPFLLSRINVFGRTDGSNWQSQNLVAYIGDSSMGNQYLTQLNDPDRSKNGLFIHLDPPRLAQYIQFKRSNDRFMTICEVEILKTECPCGKFGDRCEQTCHCTTCCDSLDGKCTRCKPGYSPPTCETECMNGTYGQNCSQNCNLNCLYAHCNAVTGSTCVEGCKPGYDFLASKDCSKGCQNGFYGNCSQQCGNCKSPPCNKEDGNCVGGCADGFKGIKCQLACLKGTYGENCSGNCSSFCVDGLCNHITGVCGRGCVPGYDYKMDPQCNYPCQDRTYGANCTHVCGHCRNPKRSCEKSTGQCANGCDLGFSGKMCKEPCVNGYFGYNCSSPCHCNGSDFKCDTRYGNCSSGCSFGYGGFNCSIDLDIIQSGAVSPRANQSSQYDECKAEKAIDGLLFTSDAEICGTCSATSGNEPPQWQLDLGRKVLLQGYRIYGRNGDEAGQSSNFDVYVSNRSADREYVEHVDSTANEDGYINRFSLPRIIQFLTLTRKQSSFLTICEVKLYYGECERDKFGEGCVHDCHCVDGEMCDGVTGECASQNCKRGWTGSSCNSPLVKDRTPFPFGAVAGGVVGLLCGVAVIVGLGFFFYRRRTRKPPTTKSSQTYTNAEFGTPKRNVSYASKNISAQISGVVHTTDADNQYYEFGNLIPGIQIHNLWDYIKDHKEKGSQHFNDEFAKLPTGLVHQHEVAAREQYKGKNRYREMYAYDHSRVPLRKERDDDCDYINASYINGYGNVRKFIASQGPTQNMIDDFWRMVWQENAEKIVMLTNLIEMAAVKCLQYWPEMEQTCSFGGIDISITGVEEFRDYEIRTLIAEKAQSDSRRIKQYHFKAWPDKDVPDNGWCLVEFLNAVETQSTNAPIIVHCSAGVGRTGTFIALDNLVDQARTEKCVRPLQMVEALRHQRVNMVQTKDQYIYLHEALAEALLMGTDHVWHRQFEEVHSFMMATEPGEKQTRMVKQFQLLEQSLTNEAQQMQDGPEYGNMETILSEIDAYRPKLKKRGSNFTQQLDAILLPGFCGNNTFLMCKSPREEQLEEFWSLVEEQHVITVIMLTSSSSRAHQTCVYMGGNGDGKVGRYSVNFIQEWKNKTFNERSFSFRDDNNEDEDNLTTVKQFQFTAWTENESLPPVQNMLDCLDDVRKWQPDLAENRAVLIHCETGHERSGLIAVLLNELHRMENTRGQINIVETVKTMKQRNRDIIPNTVQYKFIYDSLLEHVKNSTVYENIKSA